MKTLQLIGTRDKADFALYLSHVLHSLGNRVLLVDATTRQNYREGYTRLSNDEYVYDFNGIDIMCSVSNWLDIEEHLRMNNETTTNYDIILLDMDSIDVISGDWPIFNERIYVGDEERVHQTRDVELLHRVFDITDNNEIKRVTFEGSYRLDESYFDNLMNNRMKWTSPNYVIELDDFESSLKTKMQHELYIPFKQLNKQYKEVLTDIVSFLYGHHIEEVRDSVKTKFFQIFSKKKKESSLADLKAQ